MCWWAFRGGVCGLGRHGPTRMVVLVGGRASTSDWRRRGHRGGLSLAPALAGSSVSAFRGGVCGLGRHGPTWMVVLVGGRASTPTGAGGATAAAFHWRRPWLARACRRSAVACVAWGDMGQRGWWFWGRAGFNWSSAPPAAGAPAMAASPPPAPAPPASSDSLRANPPLARGCPSWGCRSRCPVAGPDRRSRPSSRPG